MKKLLLVMGDLATGKSTFADILSKRYETNVLHKDSRKEEIPGRTIVINANDFLYQTNSEILASIDEFMGN